MSISPVAFRDVFPKGQPSILEPVMKVQVEAPTEFQVRILLWPILSYPILPYLCYAMLCYAMLSMYL